MKIHDYQCEGRMYNIWYERCDRNWYGAETDKYGAEGPCISALTKAGVIDLIQRGLCPNVKDYSFR